MGRPKGSKNGIRLPKTAADEPYIAKVKLFGKLYEAQGASIADAISNLKPGRSKSMAILTVSRNGKSCERILPAMASVRLFESQGITREIQLKNVSLRFQGFDT